MHHAFNEHSDMPFYAEATPHNAAWHEQTFGYTPIGTFQIADFTLIQVWRAPGPPGGHGGGFSDG